MNAVEVASSRRTAAVVSLVVYACVSVFVVSLWTTSHRTMASQAERYVYGSPKRPFHQRILIPTIVRSAVSVLPREERRRIVYAWGAENEPFRKFLAYFKCKPVFFPEFSLVFLLVLLSVFGFAVVLRKWFDAMYQDAGRAAELCPVVALLVTLAVYKRAFFYYDLPQLFFFTAALYTLCTRQWRWFYPVVVLGFLNKETTCLILVASAATLWRSIPRRSYWIHLGTQAAIFLALFFLVQLFVELRNPGALRSSLVRDNLAQNLFRFWRWMRLADLGLVAAITILLVPILKHLRGAPAFLRRSTVLFLPFFAAHLKGGLWGEIRVLGEIFPIAFLLFYGGALELIGSGPRVAPDQLDRRGLFPGRALDARIPWLCGMLLLGGFFAVAAITAIAWAMGYRLPLP